tara:strand:+ start:423 stop:1259 length:837 start_codon:yes stop_codon:yes gene_type:complete
MVLVSGPPFDNYPHNVPDGTKSIKYNGNRISNRFTIKKQLFERENKNFKSLEFYRATSKELLGLLSTGQILGTDNKIAKVETFYANYERAIAMLFKTRNLTLPLMTLAISDTKEDPDRRRPDFDIEYWTVHNKETRRHTRVASLAPKAVKISYTLNLWTRYVEDMNQLLEYVMQLFRPHLRVETNFMTNACAFITAVSDNSTLDAPDRKDRVIRKTVTFEVETYMPTRQYQIQSNGDITDMKYEFAIEPEGTLNQANLNPSGTETITLYPLSSTNDAT